MKAAALGQLLGPRGCKVGPPNDDSVAKLVHITPRTMGLWMVMALITVVTGVYKPTNIPGGPHIVGIRFSDS